MNRVRRMRAHAQANPVHSACRRQSSRWCRCRRSQHDWLSCTPPRPEPPRWRETACPAKRTSAPSARAAASPAPSPKPPAAKTGIGATAFTTCRTITVVPISPMCPPPSVPCATITSAPASAAASASSTFGTMCMTPNSALVRLREDRPNDPDRRAARPSIARPVPPARTSSSRSSRRVEQQVDADRLRRDFTSACHHPLELLRRHELTLRSPRGHRPRKRVQRGHH